MSLVDLAERPDVVFGVIGMKLEPDGSGKFEMEALFCHFDKVGFCGDSSAKDSSTTWWCWWSCRKSLMDNLPRFRFEKKDRELPDQVRLAADLARDPLRLESGDVWFQESEKVKSP